MGAAVAQLTALYLERSGFDITHVYNFAAPRVGNKQFARYYENYFPYSFRIV